MNSAHRGFTLIELLVVMSIISVLSIVGMITYSGVKSKARDAQRKSDLRSIKVALELYKQSNGSYPTTDWTNSGGGGVWITGFDSNYFPNGMPKDPTNTGQTPWTNVNGYTYNYWALACSNFTAGQFFVLIVQLENKNDSDNLASKDYKYCDYKGLYSNYNWSGSAYVVTSL